MRATKLLNVVREREIRVEGRDVGSEIEGGARGAGAAVREAGGGGQLDGGRRAFRRAGGLRRRRLDLRALEGRHRGGRGFDLLHALLLDDGAGLRRLGGRLGRRRWGGRRRGLGPAECGRAHDANGQRDRDRDRHVPSLAREDERDDERAVHEHREAHRDGRRREPRAGPPREDLRDGARDGVLVPRQRPFSDFSSVTIPRLSTPSRLRVSIVSTTDPSGRFRSALR